MLYRPLGTTGLTVSEIGFGCASYWGKPRFAEPVAVGLVHQAIDLGVTLFDTGASYAAGQAEPRLGRALKGRDVSKLVIATKAGTFAGADGRIGRDFRPAAIRASVETSLRNLGVDAVSVLQLHGPAQDELTDELLGVLSDLKTEGLVRAVGVNSFDPGLIAHVIEAPVFDVVMIDYNLLRPEREPLIRRAAMAGKGVLAGMALAMGHTTGQVTRLKGPQDLWYAARALMRHRGEVAKGAKFAALSRRRDITGPQAALGYVLANTLVASAVIGTTRPSHLAENAAVSGMALPADLMAQVRQIQGR